MGRRLFPVTAVFIAMTLSACTGQGTTPHGRDTEIKGIWQSSGYGNIYDITTDRDGRRQLTSYEKTSVSCLRADSLVETGRDGDATDFGEDGERELTVRLQGGHLLAQTPSMAGHIRMSRLKKLPGCPSRIPEDPAARRLLTFDVFWQNLAEHYPPYEHRELDLSRRARDRAALRKDNTARKLRELLARPMHELRDMHTGVESEDDDEYGWGTRPGTRDSADLDTDEFRPPIEARLGKRLTRVIDGAVEYASGLPGGVGYVRITQFADFGDDDDTYEEDRARYRRALDTVFAAAERDDWRGLILDLRYNDGGYDTFGLDLAARLTGTPHFAFKKRARDTRADSGFTPYEEVRVRPSSRPGFHGPVALLVSDLTVSAGETATMALLNRSPKPALIGGATQGVLADELERTLPGGWSLELSNEDYRDSAGRSFEGVGIPVPRKFRTPVFTRAELRHRCDAAVAAALDHLADEPPGTTPPCPARPAK